MYNLMQVLIYRSLQKGMDLKLNVLFCSFKYFKIIKRNLCVGFV